MITTGYTWYQVNYDTPPDGWSAENWLEKVVVASTPFSSSPYTASLINGMSEGERQTLIDSLMRQLHELEMQVRGMGR